MRLQKYLAHAGIASRRAAEAIILEGRVRVDGAIVRTLGTSVPDGASVSVDGKSVEVAAVKTYVVAHKPVGMMTTMSDPEGRRTIRELLPGGERLYPVGRLDYDTAGVLLLTDDGALAHVLTHPRFGVEKNYRAVVRGRLDPVAVARILEGVALEDGAAAPARVRIIATSRDRSTIDLTIHEGRNRQVRRMLEVLGHPVLGLTRLRFGPIGLGALGPGRVRPVTDREATELRRIVAAAGEEASDE